MGTEGSLGWSEIHIAESITKIPGPSATYPIYSAVHDEPHDGECAGNGQGHHIVRKAALQLTKDVGILHMGSHALYMSQYIYTCSTFEPERR